MYSQFNPNYMPQYQPPVYQQPQQYQVPGMAGRVVADFNEITIKDIPTDGSWAYFAKADGSEIQARRWSENGAVIQSRFMKAEAAPEANPLQDRLAAIEERLEKIEKSRRRKEVENE